MNRVAAKIGNRFIRFGWRGCSDVLRQLKGGRLLGVKGEAADGRLRLKQLLLFERQLGWLTE
jgi:hypothetical protein